MSGYTDGEITLARKVLPLLSKGMLCLADRNFFGFDLWKKARARGAPICSGESKRICVCLAKSDGRMAPT
jgi:hypothetical protein